LSFSENYIKESLANTEKWAKTGLLGGISDPYIGRQLSRLMQNQLEFNEDGWQEPKVSEGMPEPDYSTAQMRRISIPVVRRVFGSFLPHAFGIGSGDFEARGSVLLHWFGRASKQFGNYCQDEMGWDGLVEYEPAGRRRTI
jgi:hypothetical protein